MFGLVLGVSVLGAHAQMMMGGTGVSGDDSKAAAEAAEGKIVWEKLQAKQLTCDTLTEEDFDLLGEYFMGNMMGISHEAMNEYMAQVAGEEAEAQMHVTMGKRMSGCDVAAAFPAGITGFMPMMQNQAGASSYGYGNMYGYNYMMRGGFVHGFFGWIFMLLWWALIIAGIVFVIRWLRGKGTGNGGAHSALTILHERYAKGEIKKEEYEEKKKVLES